MKNVQEQQNNLTPKEHDQALNWAYRSIGPHELLKTDVNTSIVKITPHIKTLIDQKIREKGLTKLQLCM